MAGNAATVWRVCIAAAEAEFSGTILYAGRRRHPEHGWIEVLGYQNTAVNLATGPNAMLLHLPARRVSSRQFLNVGRAASVLRNMVEAVTPASAAPPMSFGEMDWMGAPPRVEVFDHDIYSIVLAQDASLIPAALAQVPVHKRPRLDPQLCEFYTDHFPRHAIALCCFNNTQAQQAKPLLLWYRPLDQDRIVLPALDCHTGSAPDLNERVAVDHWVLLSSDHAPRGWGERVQYPKDLRHQLRELLPETVMGEKFAGTKMVNGDFAIAHDDLVDGRLDRLERLRPVG